MYHSNYFNFVQHMLTLEERLNNYIASTNINNVSTDRTDSHENGRFHKDNIQYLLLTADNYMYVNIQHSREQWCTFAKQIFFKNTLGELI